MAPPKDTLSSPDFLRSIFASKTDARIQRLSKILSTSSGLDVTLTLVGYGLFLVSSQLQKLELKDLTKSIDMKTSGTSLKAGGASLAKLANLSASMKALAGMCSDFRTFTRLWGLLGTYALVKKHYLDPPKDTLLKAVAWAQTLALGGYYIYENGYYLASKGVIRGWAPQKMTKWAKTSMKLFLLHVLMDYLKLWRTRQLLEEKKAQISEWDEKAKSDIEKEDVAWFKAAVGWLGRSDDDFDWTH